MKNITKLSLAALALTMGLNSCLEEVVPQENQVTSEQAAAAPNAYDNVVTTVTSSMTGQMLYDQYYYGYVNANTNHYPWDFGYASMFLLRDLMGQDMIPTSTSSWYQSIYTCGGYLTSQNGYGNWLNWYFGYTFINNCNEAIKQGNTLINENSKYRYGVGIGLAIRSMVYMDLAQYYSTETATKNPEAATVPLVLENSTNTTSNPRATWTEMLDQVIGDLKTAKGYLFDYKRSDKTTPDSTVCAGLLARAYLLKGEWANARKSAEEAMGSYSALSSAELTDHAKGFNTSDNNSWMLCGKQKSTDHCLIYNDGDTGWGSQMVCEAGPSGCGYSSNYVGPFHIDRHLFESIPATDARKDQWIDFAVSDCASEAEINAFIAPRYTDAAENIAYAQWDATDPAGACVKFRPANNEHLNQYAAFCIDIPFMRYEEMKLIQIEAAGRNGDSDAEALLTAFAQLRDPNYKYGDHAVDNNYGGGLSEFLREVHWQRRVELWGEGFATFDMKRFGTNLVRSYANSNHLSGYRWNITGTPAWFSGHIPTSESNYNDAIIDNASFSKPSEESEEYKW